MTIKWSFSYNYFVKFHDKKIWEPNLTMWCIINEVYYKRTTCAMYILSWPELSILFTDSRVKGEGERI